MASPVLEVVQSPEPEHTLTVLPVDTVRSDERYRAQPEVCDEVETLQKMGVDIAFVEPCDPHALSETDRVTAFSWIAELEKMDPKEAAALFRANPTMNMWTKFLMKAVALHPTYTGGETEHLGDGIPLNAFEQPIFKNKGPDGEEVLLTARQLLQLRKPGLPDFAGNKIKSYQDFLSMPIDDQARIIFGGFADAAAVRTRAQAAEAIAKAHFSENAGEAEGLQSVSWACGAAEPMNNIVKALGEGTFGKITLVDQDVMALAAAHAQLTASGTGAELEIMPKDLLGDKPVDYLGKKSVALGDMIGLAEYLPEETLIEMLKNVRDTLAPNSLFLLTNMMEKRPEQFIFANVVKWPRLQQRSVTTMLRCMEAAGYDLANLQVRIPAAEGVYAVYAYKEPAEDAKVLTHPSFTGVAVRAGEAALEAA